MVTYRSILALVLAAIAAMIVSCGGQPQVSQPPTYTDAQLERIQTYKSDLLAMRDRMARIPDLVDRRQWSDIQSLIHGPLGALRMKMFTLAHNLNPSEEKPAMSIAKDLFDYLVEIDDAAAAGNANKILSNYAAALKDFDAFLEQIPPEAA
ncbi:MAG: photosystem II protein PsbQ [Elainellaceae cyanobacterium]